MTLPSLSLVTPVFNGSDFLAQAMESVLSQGYPNLQYVVMDGGSTDGSQAIIEARAEHLHLWRSEPDGGMYDALNKGFAETSAEIMGWLNADDLHCPWTLALVGSLFRQFPEIDWLTARWPLIWNRSGLAVRCRERGPFSARSFRTGHNLPRPGCLTDGWIQQESTFWRRSLWEKAGGRLDTSLALAADFELWHRFFDHADLIAVDAPIAGFRRHGEQKTALCGDTYRREALDVLARRGHKPASPLQTSLAEIKRRLLPRRLVKRGKMCVYAPQSDSWMLTE